MGLIVDLIWIQMLGIDTNIMNLIKVVVDCLSFLDTNVKDGYECYEFYIGWVWLLSHLDTKVKDNLNW